ncbi:MAG: hypothetical protein DF168_01091 [Candidatus Moanabacter tarae]|uniref:Uncharacterized protein n=1 Tax=Candidatus Moanibacter tarae TaxID=2200854 RepID=A0A2Z4AHV2_9BACT|nr:MAG: hypothetical protein DF168_01091 [Candidatus Moanabacter tarae]|tara:strand:+ start:11664 stop:11822 length:159 start_codon:yes stop_codon:yes gene_type:complete
MTAGGWIILIMSIGTVSILFFWCIFKVLSTPKETKHDCEFKKTREKGRKEYP